MTYLPLMIFLRDRLGYALKGDEIKKIYIQQYIEMDSKVCPDTTCTAEFMDIISIKKTRQSFCPIYDTTDHFVVYHIMPKEAKYMLYKMRKMFVGTKGLSHLVNHDVCTLHGCLYQSEQHIQIYLETGKTTGVTTNFGFFHSFDVVHVRDTNGNSFATWLSNIFPVGKDNKV
ncbi:40S ribosomal protein S4, X isoform-like [Orycteropus afer afer]|uniref:40S ribosomal protein S4, X isoform-like n=1 Tax=Orycteropus afer afer TaxID=1230840 RepID=A0AC54Z934_ORYAF|nr:40S ribosomal protein S4, X isoform-like [Orycteropus afer afer]